MRGARVAGVELVGADDAPDDVAAVGVVVLGEAHPEPRNLDEHLAAAVGEEIAVGGGLVVLPDVVGDREADVVRTGAGIRVPPSRVRVQVQAGALLAPVAAGLPREHRALVAGLLRGLACLGQTPDPVHEQLAGERRQPQIEDGEDEDLVPEDVSPVCLAVQPARGHAGIDLGGVRRDGL